MAENIMKQLIDKGKVVRGWLGVTIQDVNENTAKVLNLKDAKGVIIGDVVKDSPADKAKLKSSDVVIELNGEKVANTDELRNRIAAITPGTKVDLTVIRDEKKMNITVKLGELPDDIDQLAATTEKSKSNIGITVSSITPQIASQFDIDENEPGVIITRVDQGSVAERANLRVGNIIKKINKDEIKSVKDYNRAMEKLEPGDPVLMLIWNPNSGTYFVSFEIPEE
jgi:serine protease Do